MEFYRFTRVDGKAFFLKMFTVPLITTGRTAFTRQAFKIRPPHNFAILREAFALKNEVITASMPKIIVNAAIAVQEYKLNKKLTAITEPDVKNLLYLFSNAN
ncbi:MAG: hypothetical protein M1412_01270 [Deltaproteobacteria bacterium]|nr:hypothetical protein [Deltaproteobacteria bacterium]